MTTDTTNQEIRGVLIQVEGAHLLLPNATISEVLSYSTPEPVDNAPEWLLGRLRWRGWQVPLVSFSRLSGTAEEQGGLGSKVIILKALGGNPKFPYFALLTQGFPRLVTVSRDRLAFDAEEQSGLPEAVQASVTLNEDLAWLPDLARLETMIGEALRAAA
jgi:chemosensory pili system protein ChpC